MNSEICIHVNNFVKITHKNYRKANCMVLWEISFLWMWNWNVLFLKYSSNWWKCFSQHKYEDIYKNSSNNLNLDIPRFSVQSRNVNILISYGSVRAYPQKTAASQPTACWNFSRVVLRLISKRDMNFITELQGFKCGTRLKLLRKLTSQDALSFLKIYTLCCLVMCMCPWNSLPSTWLA